MEIFPAVDILSGNCVQLVGGDRLTATVYGSPMTNARRWIQDGASNLHIVNLDGAFAASHKNVDQIRELIETMDVFVQVGGGIRSLEDARGWLNCGVSRIILSTFATREPAVIRQLSNEFGSERIMAGVDARKGELAISGWQELAGDYIGWAEKFEELGAGSLLYTNVDVEGKEAGIDGAPVQKLIDAVSIPVIVAGGVTTPSDISLLKQLGANGCVLGSALYSGKISLKEALEAAV
ncbi:MAG: 1-(5-phosphoribosyl)-5-[(5-phosphoribosylamino)methylideneamino]imidazole-4-carboxamide isomerase [Methanocorpusculum sp.]|jgi:phosphoribosylformimino-5-aminoimidazole carboxamide ribotide isomerase|nr:1-(5-phosphoribosyl)-5-[(5-phosphoribosylamino)methylideneamino]imidazole-4-carboxamide isomerase [Methanocorpusculum sp.]MDD2470870.1 1-(5-phosphoribosyl)-5-[(5-phosphoribosylamino)methylideneamino]imidazole-4-carboxamide isomerase [Methanocorpusculum sp.]MDD3257600.1 1-(5-phosphoribosyl)-5-[(5-phosphoribosylamino)methylideneamino]imidazole-4-carboxamide isomerase [Methanocorpusculum sp.]MDD4133097.1 1-(5-phosphoribosyl)-5-[(5-phosphoribosylamino)methylideneamino]imidazole-4-carboxamide isom